MNSGDRKADLDILRDFSSRWNGIGFVPRKSLDGLMENVGGIDTIAQDRNVGSFAMD